jgi:methylmalonyl-CoA mutase N-terminal domain/subunit
MRLTVDTMEFGSAHVPKWNTISISGYHIREAGSTAAQELAFTLADGFAYVKAGIERGMDIDRFAPRLSFFFNSHLDLFEEVAKYRAARRIWAREMKVQFKAKNSRSWLMRFHTQTAGCTLTAQQPENNIVRVTWQALAAVLGGTQSLHTNSMDETLALPTEKAALIALRTQQLIAHESGCVNTIDPLAGSYFVESLTNRLEEEAYAYFDKIEQLGGIVKAIEMGYPQREIAEAAFLYQRAIDNKDRIIVGVNDYILEDEQVEIPILKIDPQVEQSQCQKLNELRKNRNNIKTKKSLDDLRDACRGKENLMVPILEAVRAYATLGEIAGVLKEIFGEYREPPIYW